MDLSVPDSVMNKFAPIIAIAPQPQQPLPDKQIWWGSQDGGCNHFPTGWDVLNERIHSDNPAPLIAFAQAVSNANSRVWIIDEYLLMPDKGKGTPQIRLEQILEWLPYNLEASDIRFLTKQHKEISEVAFMAQLRAHAQIINDHSVRRKTQCSIELRTHLTRNFAFIHDRFAIIDDELWHFGGTVGGFHASVSAASRGWRASDHGAIDFFEMAWNAGVRK
jgi:hypothetical protein